MTANPNVGGRYSALSQFGLVPAALMGVDLDEFLWAASDMAARCSQDQPLVENTGALLGIILGEAALAGKDKLTFLTDEAVAPLGAWLEQLVAESSGKLGKGIVPVADEPWLRLMPMAMTGFSPIYGQPVNGMPLQTYW